MDPNKCPSNLYVNTETYTCVNSTSCLDEDDRYVYFDKNICTTKANCFNKGSFVNTLTKTCLTFK